MAQKKKDTKDSVNTLIQGITETANNVNDNNDDNNTNKNDDKNNNENNDSAKPKSTRGRKKSVPVEVTFHGKKVTIKKKEDVIEKSNKTFYLEKKYIDILDELESKTGISSSELAQVAIQLLENNLELQGFDN